MVPKERVLAALREFDSKLRDSADFVGWEQRLSQKYAIDLEGRRYPPKQIVSLATGLPVSQFSGGAVTNNYLKEVASLRIIDLQPRAIADRLDKLLSLYPDAVGEPVSKESEIAATMRQLEELLAKPDILEAHPAIRIKTSYGKGIGARVPWIAFLDERETHTAQSGVYVVILFSRDGSGCYVTFNQGVTEAREDGGGRAVVRDTLRTKAREIRQTDCCKTLERDGFKMDDEIDLVVDRGRLGNDYEASTIAYKYYARGAIPNDEVIASDLEILLAAYESYLSGRPRSVIGDSVHLLLKWSVDRRPDTVEVHRALADQKGSAWWGKMGSNIGDAKFTQVTSQLDEGKSTYVFLVGGNEVWQTDLASITRDPNLVGAEEIPDYYSKSECSFFVKLQAFKKRDRAWLISNTVGDARLTPGSTEGLLSGRSSLGYVRMVSNTTDSRSQGASSMDEMYERLEARTLLDRQFLEELVKTITGGSPQIVLAGPPGTSKTWVALALAEFVAEAKERVTFVQFHPNFSYEAFIEGLRPVAKSGAISFEHQPGVLKSAVHRMSDRSEIGAGQPWHVIVIDEMNRANLARVFGELMYLFEYRGDAIRLQYSDSFSLPKNLLFIGAMNTADRSIRSIDIALRRRFDVFELRPDSRILERFFQKATLNVPGLVEGFARLNADLSERLDRHHEIGHAFFMKDGLDRKMLIAVWQRKIFPLIEEYFFDQPDIAEEFTLEKYWPDSQ